ncbi:MAG: phosphoenolpyruvate--protein phosphotransferase, partial [Anaerolineales bacterium]|nr:phosphoenolpyruvate--protein phosphotransferase [Anaerolineales bacterium]
DGDDENEAFQAIEQAFATGLGEEELIQETKNGHQQKGKVASKTAAKPVQTAAPTASTNGQDGNIIQGIAAAPGIAVGPIYQLKRDKLVVDEPFTNLAAEQTRLQGALTAAKEALKALYQEMVAKKATAEADIFEVHRELLEDADLLEGVNEQIENQQQSAPQAWQEVIENRAQMLAGLQDELLAGRAADMRDVGQRVLRLMLGLSSEGGLNLPDGPVVLIAHDLAPSDTAALDRDKVLGFATAVGGPTSHSAIIARALNLPAIVGSGEGILALANGTTAILNGTSGRLALNPDQATIEKAKTDQKQWVENREAAAAAAHDPAITQDGHQVEVVANIGGHADAVKAVKAGAEGVGLLRTEFLFLERETAPTEEEQYAIYEAIVKTMGQRPVIVRTLDIGGDKPLPYIDTPAEENPFLGLRGIRLCLDQPELLREQLRAVLRAASHGLIRIMFPMVSNILEFRQARAMVEEIRAEVGAPEVEVGIMIEIPSAALMADVFAQEVDFFSVGTNDLTQYTLAVDRMHPTLAALSDGLHPAVLRLIHQTVAAAHKAGKWVGVCGELGSDPQAVPILVGLGVDELSVTVPAVPITKALVRALTLTDAQALAQKALQAATAAEVRALVAS